MKNSQSKTIKIGLISIIFISSLLFIRCDKSDQNIEEVNNQKKELVLKSFKKFIKNIENSSEYKSFITTNHNSELLKKKKRLNISQEDINLLIGPIDESFIEILKQISDMGITKKEFDEIVKENKKIIETYKNQYYQTRAIVPNDKACAVSMGLASSTVSCWSCVLGWIGVYVHC